MVEIDNSNWNEGIWASSNLVTCAEQNYQVTFICFKCIAWLVRFMKYVHKTQKKKSQKPSMNELSNEQL